jgi:ribosomal subunit interface protein
MRTTITARHCEISDELHERARLVLGRLANHTSGAVNGMVIFDVGPIHQTAEIRLHASRDRGFVATAEATDHRTALDRAERKLRRQLEKGSSKSNGRRPRSRQRSR